MPWLLAQTDRASFLLHDQVFSTLVLSFHHVATNVLQGVLCMTVVIDYFSFVTVASLYGV